MLYNAVKCKTIYKLSLIEMWNRKWFIKQQCQHKQPENNYLFQPPLPYHHQFSSNIHTVSKWMKWHHNSPTDERTHAFILLFGSVCFWGKQIGIIMQIVYN